ncbi:MAG: 3TM-type holin [Desulfovibrio aminophilus]|uniref:3TM-type holin n=1 Tax=Desulfovibrio aminophilus TaxID=81425 RepID=UPI0039EA0DC5
MGLMSVIGRIFTGGASSVVDAVGSAADKLFTSDEERAKAQAELEELRQKPYVMQIMTNLAEAAHKSVFVAGWRPFLGWIGGLALASYYLPKHVMGAVLWSWQCIAIMANAPDIQAVVLPAYPVELSGTIMELILGMLGLAVTRSWEKKEGVAR